MLKPTKILVPTDFSEYSDKALKQALDIAKQYGAKVFLFHVIHEEVHQCVVDYCITDQQLTAVKEQMMNESRASLEKQLAKFPQAAGEVEVVPDVKLGVPYEAILEEEKEKGIDLIVIASLGRTGIAKYLIGSVARNVLKGAKCPVLLTK
ncbi:MAG TPA: universal stress protein [Syntrophorhabdaceae bacterium]|jgi:nucleotide-binding universal stress UspA family protein